jgi:hypothetical protein
MAASAPASSGSVSRNQSPAVKLTRPDTPPGDDVDGREIPPHRQCRSDLPGRRVDEEDLETPSHERGLIAADS